MNSDKEFEVLNWNITSDTELTLKFQMKGKFLQGQDLSIQKKISSMSSGPVSAKVESPAQTQPIAEIKSFNIKDRLKLFEKKKGESNSSTNNNIGFQKSLTLPSMFNSTQQSNSPTHKNSITSSGSGSLLHNQTVSSSTSTLSTLNSNESFLECITNEEYLKLCQGNSTDSKEPLPQRDCFCEGFFLASFPMKGGKVIEKSQEYPSICNHKQCSMLPAMQSEIIYRYPLKDTKTLELNNLAATICFPTGIKVCYEEDPPETVKNYSTPITNQQGDRYYMMTFHFYFKLLNSEYGKLYEMHPLKHHLMKFADSYLGLDDLDKKTKKNIEENLALCQDLGFKDVVYVPYCLCLISKFPYIRQMEVCLQSLYKIMSGFKTNGSDNINEIIMFLINSIPIPLINTRLKFYLPFCPHGIEINCPRYKDMNILNYNLTNLLTLFSVENIITIFRLMLFEKKILFVDKEYNRLSEVTDSFISLLYPFQWIHTYIPIMSDQMIKYLETFLPFLNGINETLMPFVKDTLIENEDEVYIIYIAKNQIDINLSLRGKKIKIQKKIDETTPNIPNKLVKKLTKSLSSIKSKVEEINNTNSSNKESPNSSLENNRTILDMKIKNAFIEIIVEMFHDYNKYLCSVDDDVVFNSNLLVDNRPKEDSYFYKEFTDTQLFQQFTQNVLKDDFNYFNAMIEEFEAKSEKDTVIDSSFKNEHTYIIKPLFMETKETELLSFEKELKEKYDIAQSRLNENGIIKESERVVGKVNEIVTEKYNIDKCKLYIFPGSLETLGQLAKKKEKKSSLIASKADIFEARERFNKSQKLMTKFNKRENELNDKEKDAIKETIKDAIVRIFKSEDIKENKEKDRKDVLQAMNNSFGRDFFIKLLYKNNTNVKILQKDAFDLLFTIVYNELLHILKIEENEKTLSDTVLLLKSCCFYGISNTKLIWTELCPKLYNYALVLKEVLWSKWYENDIKEKNGEGKKDIIIEVLNDLLKKMLQLKLEKDFIKKTIDNLVDKKIFDEEEIETFKKKVIETISGYKYN